MNPKQQTCLVLFIWRILKCQCKGASGVIQEQMPTFYICGNKSSREVKGFSQRLIHDRTGTWIWIHISWLPGQGSLCYLQCSMDSRARLPDSDLGSPTWATLVVIGCSELPCAHLKVEDNTSMVLQVCQEDYLS